MLDAEDVAFSFVRMSERGIIRTAVANKVNPNAPVISVSGADPRTVVIKLKEPLVFAMDLFTRRQAPGARAEGSGVGLQPAAHADRQRRLPARRIRAVRSHDIQAPREALGPAATLR